MPDDTNLSRRARERQKRTGEKYTEALRSEQEPSGFWTQVQVDAAEAQISEHPDDVTTMAQLAGIYFMGAIINKIASEWLRWDIDASEAGRRGKELLARVIGDFPDSEAARNYRPGLCLQDGPVRISFFPHDVEIAELWDQLAAQEPRHREAAETYRSWLRTEPVVDVLERWAATGDQGAREYLDKARSQEA